MGTIQPYTLPVCDIPQHLYSKSVCAKLLLIVEQVKSLGENLEMFAMERKSVKQIFRYSKFSPSSPCVNDTKFRNRELSKSRKGRSSILEDAIGGVLEADETICEDGKSVWFVTSTDNRLWVGEWFSWEVVALHCSVSASGKALRWRAGEESLYGILQTYAECDIYPFVTRAIGKSGRALSKVRVRLSKTICFSLVCFAE